MKRVQLRRVFIFLFLTFLLSWGFDWLVYQLYPTEMKAITGVHPWGMLAPAFVAILLQMFIFTDSRIYFRNFRAKPRWIFLSYLIVTILYGLLIILACNSPSIRKIFQGISALLYTLWTLFVISIFGQAKRENPDALADAGLQMGNTEIAPRFILGIVLFLLLQAVLNLVFGLGDLAARQELIYGLPLPPVLYIPALVLLFLPVTVIGIPLSGLAGVFGEEYGWRGFLQSQLTRIGKWQGVLMVGFIWGLWHLPIILRGTHTYPPTVLGILLALLFFILWGVIQGYAVLKTGSIWLAAFMHGVVNSVYAFTLQYIARPDDKLVSFGLGIFGILLLAIIVAFIFRDPVWKKSE